MMRIQTNIIIHVLMTILLVGCGGGSPGSPMSDQSEDREAYYSLNSDTYGIKQPTWIEASNDAIGLVLRAEEVTSSQEMWFDTNIFRIDCRDGIAPGTYDLGESESVCTLQVFNGCCTSQMTTVAGSLTVTEAGDWFSGSFEAVITDSNLSEEQLHWFSASFSAPVGNGEALASLPEGVDKLF